MGKPRNRLFIIFLIIACAAIGSTLCASPSSAITSRTLATGDRVPNGYHGTWRGASTTAGGSWTISLALSGGARGGIVGTIAYPSLQCGGKLSLTQISSGSIRLLQDIVYGNCIDGLTVTLSLINDTTIHYTESYPGGQVTGSGNVNRINGSNNTLASQYVGVWEGAANQVNPNVQWPILMTISGGSIDSVIGIAGFAPYRCGAELGFLRTNSNSVELLEDVTYGSCWDLGTITLSPNPDGSLKYQWRSPDGVSSAVGSVTRINSPISTIDCSEPVYYGIQHCSKEDTHIFYIDPKNPHVRFETVLALGEAGDGTPGECKDVNRPRYSLGPGCIAPDGTYPAQRVGHMVSRYPGAVLAFNGDLFGSNGFTHGPEGLIVKNGTRFDGTAVGDCDSSFPPPQDANGRCDPPGNDVKRPSIAFSRIGGQVDISRKRIEDLENLVLYTDRFYNTVGGFPILVENGQSVVDHECEEYPGTCTSMSGSIKRARTAIGKTEYGELIVIVMPETSGLTFSELATKMIELGAVEAINLDGGTSSQLWYAGATSSDNYLVTPRGPVAEGVFVFSNPGTTYTISGQVKDTNNAPVQGVTISAGSISTATDGNGNYTLSDVEPGTYTVTPSKADYSFSPSTSQVSVPPEVSGQNFTGSLSCPVITTLGPPGASQANRILAATDLITLYRRFRNEVLSTTTVGQGYVKAYNQHSLELSAILLTHSDLRSRTAQFLEHAAPAFESLLPNRTNQSVLTQGLYDEAAGLVTDLANAGSPQLRNDIQQTWGDLALDVHIGESPTTIWGTLQQPSVYLPLVVR